MSVIDECKRSCITETDVARLFNAVGRRVATGVPGEDSGCANMRLRTHTRAHGSFVEHELYFAALN